MVKAVGGGGDNSGCRGSMSEEMAVVEAEDAKEEEVGV